jgi:glycosidase
MTDVAVPPALRQDKMSAGNDAWQGSRDRGRTPMQWDASPTGGFTAGGVTPWLPAGDTAACNVAGQRQDPASILSLCRDLLALRRAEVGGRIADYEELAASETLWVYRTGGLVVAANFSDEPAGLPGPVGEVLLASTGTVPPASGAISLRPWQGIIGRYATSAADSRD